MSILKALAWLKEHEFAEKYNPYHDERGRFTSAEYASGDGKEIVTVVVDKNKWRNVQSEIAKLFEKAKNKLHRDFASPEVGTPEEHGYGMGMLAAHNAVRHRERNRADAAIVEIQSLKKQSESKQTASRVAANNAPNRAMARPHEERVRMYESQTSALTEALSTILKHSGLKP